jgi:3-oxoacyl-[acyl-carrier protein] reductase
LKIDLTGRTALVTGASRGIGEAIARRLGETGAKVLCAARTPDAVERVAGEIRDAGGDALGVVLDIAGDDARERVEQLIGEHQKIDILVNNAGVTADDLFLRMKKDAWDRVIRTNLDSIYPITQAVIKKMVRNRWGRIINITSIVGITGNPGQANYAASKAGIIGLTKSLALELGSRNITVNAVAPGFVRTAMTEEMTDAAKESMESRIALGRLGTPDDIAWSVVFLASEQAAYITGTVLNVSGGLVTI